VTAYAPASPSLPVERRKRRNVRRSSTEQLFDDDASPPDGVDPETGDDSDGDAIVSALPQNNVGSLPMASAVRRKFKGAERRGMLQCRIIPLASAIARRVSVQFWHERIAHDGFCVVPGIFPPASTDPEVRKAVVMAQADVDELFGFFRDAWKKDQHLCCDKAEKPVFDTIVNSKDRSAAALARSKRYQTPRVSIHQHLEKHHPTMFLLKLRMDVVTAMLLEELNFKSGSEVQYVLPNTGGRLLMSSPGCPAQPAHTDFKIRYKADGTAVANFSLFVILTGREAASVLMWTGSHMACAHLQMLLDTAERKASRDGKLELDAIGALEEELCAGQPSTRVMIPPYSAFVARGDVVHAGDAHDGTDIGLRYHVHCRSNHDAVLNNVFMKPFIQQ
jgi:hypothetical protein